MISLGGYLKSNELRVVIRVDASRIIGTGHMVRCLTLAKILQKKGAIVCFISRLHDKHFCDLIQQNGFDAKLLASPEKNIKVQSYLAHAAWLGVDWEQDAAQTISAILSLDNKPDWLVVDHYAVDERWHGALRPYVTKIMVIDDIADRTHDCDILLDQNYHRDMELRYRGKVPEHCNLLLGPRFSLLGEEYNHLYKQVKPRTKPVKKILIFLGGVDAGNYTMKAIEAVAIASNQGMQVDVVIGALHPQIKNVEILCKGYGFKCHIQTNRMAELIANADLAIGAGGSANWERCCLGLPCITIAVAANQEQTAKSLSLLGVTNYIGKGGDITVSKLIDEINKALDSTWINQASICGLNLLDGLGANRIAGMIFEPCHKIQ